MDVLNAFYEVFIDVRKMLDEVSSCVDKSEYEAAVNRASECRNLMAILSNKLWTLYAGEKSRKLSESM